jgi:hypothetical protein
MVLRLHIILICCLTAVLQSVSAGVLPDDRADLMYHSYDGGGVKIDGPSLLVRKQVSDNFSVFGNYYVDSSG